MKFLALLLLLISPGSSKEGWSRFRGDNGSGNSKIDLPIIFNQKTLKFSTQLPGPGSSSPIIWKSHLYITAEAPSGQDVYLICLDAHTGQKKWQAELPVRSYSLHRFNSKAASTPSANDHAVIVSWFNGDTKRTMISAFSHKGKKLWDYEVGAVKTSHGPSLQPIIHDNFVIFAHLHHKGGYVSALDLKTGQPRWKKEYPGSRATYVAPYIHQTESGSEIIAASQACGVISLDLLTGEEKWSLPKTFKHRTITSPINVLEGTDSNTPLIAVGCKNGIFFAAQPPNREKPKASIAWRMKGNTPYVPTPVSNGHTLFVLSDGGMLSALEAKTGNLLWKQSLQGNFYASPIISNQKLYALSREGEIIVIDASKSPKKYHELSRFKLTADPKHPHTDSTPAVSHHNIYLRIGSRIECHGKHTP